MAHVRRWPLLMATLLLGLAPRASAQDWTVPFPPLPGEEAPAPAIPTRPARPSAPARPATRGPSASVPTASRPADGASSRTAGPPPRAATRPERAHPSPPPPLSAETTPAASPGSEGSAALEGPCLRPAIRIARAHAHPAEEAALSLTLCDGSPNPAALAPLSVLARPSDVELPRGPADESEEDAPGDGGAAPGLKLLHPGLLTRLQALADRFPDTTISIVSGYRPRSRRTSRHHSGRALDVALEGVDRREVAEYARAHLEGTGVGYYPNSTFTHIDVRDARYAWIDTSGPGQRQRRRPWPLEIPEAPEARPDDAAVAAAEDAER